MEKFLESMLMSAMQDENAGAKALANYMFRDIVEDIHAEGKITDSEMEKLNREACNRAALFWDYVMPNKDMRTAFLIEAVNALTWDPPVMTDEVKKKLDFYQNMGLEISSIKKHYKQMKKEMEEADE